MPKEKGKPVKYPNFDSFPNNRPISASMIQNSYIRMNAQYVRAAVLKGELKGYLVGRNCYMTKDQIEINFGKAGKKEPAPQQKQLLSEESIIKLTEIINNSVENTRKSLELLNDLLSQIERLRG